ncbi:MAG: hypothetical protein IPP78_13910 [Holophagaceae bacterium]|nr:hypothetical protein [Holophagaceae bacterium]
MKKKIGGWWRLWIALSAMYGLIVIFVVVVDWPRDLTNRKLSPKELKSLTEESLGLISNVLPYSVPAPDDDWVEAPIGKASVATKKDPLAALEAKYGIKTHYTPLKKQQKSPVAMPPWESAPQEHRGTLAQPQKKVPSKVEDSEYTYSLPSSTSAQPRKAVPYSVPAPDDTPTFIDGRVPSGVSQIGDTASPSEDYWALAKSQPLQNGEYLIFRKIPTPAQIDLVKKDLCQAPEGFDMEGSPKQFAKGVTSLGGPLCLVLGPRPDHPLGISWLQKPIGRIIPQNPMDNSNA